MTTRAVSLIVLASMAIALTVAAPAIAKNKFWNAGIDNDQSVYDVLAKLQTAVRHDDRNTVASLMRYPLNVDIIRMGRSKADSVTIRSRRQFLRRYDWIIDAQTRKRILTAKPSDLDSSWRGVSFYSDPDIWFEGQINSNKILITAITHVK